jgi:hypothetical protein
LTSDGDKSVRGDAIRRHESELSGRHAVQGMIDNIPTLCVQPLARLNFWIGGGLDYTGSRGLEILRQSLSRLY